MSSFSERIAVGPTFGEFVQADQLDVGLLTKNFFFLRFLFCSGKRIKSYLEKRFGKSRFLID